MKMHNAWQHNRLDCFYKKLLIWLQHQPIQLFPLDTWPGYIIKSRQNWKPLVPAWLSLPAILLFILRKERGNGLTIGLKTWRERREFHIWGHGRQECITDGRIAEWIRLHRRDGFKVALFCCLQASSAQLPIVIEWEWDVGASVVGRLTRGDEHSPHFICDNLWWHLLPPLHYNRRIVLEICLLADAPQKEPNCRSILKNYFEGLHPLSFSFNIFQYCRCIYSLHFQLKFPGSETVLFCVYDSSRSQISSTCHSPTDNHLCSHASELFDSICQTAVNLFPYDLGRPLIAPSRNIFVCTLFFSCLAAVVYWEDRRDGRKAINVRSAAFTDKKHAWEGREVIDRLLRRR